MQKSLSKFQTVSRYIRQEIVSGRWAPGASLPPNEQLGKLLGVSEITIRHVLTNCAQEGLVIRRQRLGTFVAESRVKPNVALLLHAESLASPMAYFYRSIYRQFVAWCDAGGYHPLVITEYGDEPEVLRLLLKNTVGVFAMIGLEKHRRVVEELGIHLIEMFDDDHGDHHSVEFDYRDMTTQARRELERRGFDDFIVVDQQIREDEAPGLHQLLAREMAGANPKRLLSVPYSWDSHLAYDAFKSWWRPSRRRRAVFFYDDGLCDSALRAIAELGIRVPEELAILTQSNVGRHFNFPVPLARIEFDPTELLRSACALFERCLARQAPKPEHITLKPRFIPGASLPDGI